MITKTLEIRDDSMARSLSSLLSESRKNLANRRQSILDRLAQLNKDTAESQLYLAEVDGEIRGLVLAEKLLADRTPTPVEKSRKRRDLRAETRALLEKATTPMTPAEVAEALAIKLGQASSALDWLRGRGAIVANERGFLSVVVEVLS